MFGMNRRAALGVALIVALVMMSIGSSVAFGDGATATTVCVAGTVIDHLEQPVNGTLTQPPLIVEALDASGKAQATAPVGANGAFTFAALPVGSWNFQLKLPPDWEGIVPQAVLGGVAQTGATNLAAQKGCYRILFKIRRQFTVTVQKWEELLDGSVRPGAGWAIWADPVPPNPSVGSVGPVLTNAAGQAVLTLTAGVWNIREIIPPGWVQVTPGAWPWTIQITLNQTAASSKFGPVVFKNRQPPCTGGIIVEKYGYGEDGTGNSVPLGPLANWLVDVDPVPLPGPPGANPGPQMTGAQGIAVFPNLPLGVYNVNEIMQPGWTAMTALPQVVVLNECVTKTVRINNQEVKPKLRIYGWKTLVTPTAANPNNGVGLAGWTITAELVGSNPRIAVNTTTDAVGYYEFTQKQLESAGMAFPGAAINVCEEARAGWNPVPPATICQLVTFPTNPLAPVYLGAPVDFKNCQTNLCPPCPTVWPHPPKPSFCRGWHVIQRGQTLSGLAAWYGVSLNALMAANGITNPNMIYVGQKLCIP